MAFGIELGILIFTILLLLYLYTKHTHNFWQRKGIASLKPTFIFGNIRNVMLLVESTATLMQKMYHDKIGEDKPILGIYLLHTPAILVKNLSLVKKILIKDFNFFSNRFSTVDPHVDALGYYNMFFVKNPEWKEVRTSITPLFTSGKLRQMFSLVNDIGHQLNSHLCGLEADANTNKICLEMKEISACYTTDVIASVAYGIQANSLKNPNGEFRRNGQKIFTFTPGRSLKLSLIFFNPFLARILRSKFFSGENTEFLRGAIHSAIETREKSGIERGDLIDILVALKKTEMKNGIKITDDLLVSQAAVFFSAGHETSSSTMAFTLYELSKNIDCQKRLREEIRDVLKNGELCYDNLINMEYLNMVVMEVLRLYPPLPFLDRECTSSRGYSLEPELNYTIPSGMAVYIPVYAIQRDPAYFPDPDRFDPERFSSANKNKIIPYTYIPFGLGPHNCIGERLGLIQAKVGLINILKNHFVELSSKTADTMKLDPTLIIQSHGGIHCELVKDPLW